MSSKETSFFLNYNNNLVRNKRLYYLTSSKAMKSLKLN